MEGDSIGKGRHRLGTNFMLDLGESSRFGLQRAKSFWVRGMRLDSAGHVLILGQGGDIMIKVFIWPQAAGCTRK